MAFKGAMTLIVLLSVAVSATSAAASRAKAVGKENAKADPRLFFFPTGTANNNTSVTVSSEFMFFLSLLFLVLLGALLIPALIGGSLFASDSGYSASGYDSYAPSAYAHDQSSYASIHRSLEDAEAKYHTE